MPRRSPKALLQDILDAIELIEQFVSGFDVEAFRKDPRTSAAVLRHLEIVGEAVRNLPENLRQAHPDIPWQDIIGMRNLLAHAYFIVDLHEAWEAATRDLPALKAKAAYLLAEEEKVPT